MRDVRRFASWGMSEWMDFLRINAERDLYLVECSTYAVSQINLVTGLLGHGKLVSFYASFRCGSCSEERESLFLIPRDRAMIRDLPGYAQPCPTCGGHARLEEYPASFFETIADRRSFDIDDEVLGFLRSQLKYDLAPDLTRFRAHRRVHKDYTYLRLSGNVAMLPGDLLASVSTGTTVADLEGIVFEPSQLTEWRRTCGRRCPGLRPCSCSMPRPGSSSSAVTLDDLRDKLKVRNVRDPVRLPGLRDDDVVPGGRRREPRAPRRRHRAGRGLPDLQVRARGEPLARADRVHARPAGPRSRSRAGQVPRRGARRAAGQAGELPHRAPAEARGARREPARPVRRGGAGPPDHRRPDRRRPDPLEPGRRADARRRSPVHGRRDAAGAAAEAGRRAAGAGSSPISRPPRTATI